MTPQEKQQYLDGIRKQEGSNLNGLERPTYRKGVDAAATADRARTELQKVMGTVRQLEQVIQTSEGRAQACFELLVAAEEERRAAQPTAAQVADQLAAELSEQPVEANT